MATKEDILEQVVEDYLSLNGYFVQHNVKFVPSKSHPDFDSKQDSNHSDIDVLGINPRKSGTDAVMAVSCKSWQAGFNPAREIDAIENGKVLSGRARWRTFRELCVPKWSEAFVSKVRELTGSDQFTHVTAVSHIRGDREIWETYPGFLNAMNGNPVRLLAFKDIALDVQSKLTTTLAATEIGRLLQMIRASGLELSERV